MHRENQRNVPEPGIKCRLIGWDSFYRLARQLAWQVRDSGFEPEIIVGISRGGLMPARILCDYLNLFDLATVKIEHYHAAHKERIARIRYPLTATTAGRRVLLVDDVSDTGDSLLVATNHMREQGAPAALKTAVLHHKRVSSFVPDYFAQELVEWRWLIYPWAVIEDLSSFLKEMERPPHSLESFARHLKQKHDIRASRKILADVLSINGIRVET